MGVSELKADINWLEMLVKLKSLSYFNVSTRNTRGAGYNFEGARFGRYLYHIRCIFVDEIDFTGTAVTRVVNLIFLNRFFSIYEQ